MIKSLLPIILVAVAVGLFYTFIDPTYKEVQELKQEEQKFDDALQKSRELQALRDTLLAQYNSFSENDLERLNKMLPDHVDNVRLALDVNSVASQYSMRIKNITVSDAPRAVRRTGSNVLGELPDTFESVTISFVVASTYNNLIAFIKDLERSLRVVDLTELSFSSGEGDLHEYQLSFKTYWMP